MRFESSLLMSVCTTDGSVLVFRLEAVGNDSSSATNGSSMTIVAGKKRDPAKPWAKRSAVGKMVSAVATASLAQRRELTAHIGRSLKRSSRAIGIIAPSVERGGISL